MSESPVFALHGFLDVLSASTLGRLYESPSSCLAVFRLLPLAARHIVMDLLWMDNAVPRSLIARMTNKTPNVLESLSRLNITLVSPDDIVLHRQFCTSLRKALLLDSSTQSFGVPVPEETMQIKILDYFAKQTWDNLLLFMVSEESAAQRPPQSVLKFLVNAQYMTTTSSNLRHVSITAKGFQFLLAELQTQLWHLLLAYLEAHRDLTVEVLSFIFTLGSLELGRAYRSGSSPSEAQMLRDFAELGLVYIPPSSDGSFFFPTRLAVTLTSTSSSPLAAASKLTIGGSKARDALAPSAIVPQETQEHEFIVVETNYKVYAYTSNPLQIAILALFVNIKTQFPNLLTGVLTRDSINNALAKGIDADQIITYLHTHAHPQQKLQPTVLPTTVVDQIRLWEREKHRLRRAPGTLFRDFASDADFALVADYARQLEVLLWESPQHRKLFVTPEGHQQLREFILRRKK